MTRGEQMGLAAVIGMGVILVVGFVSVVFTIATRLSDGFEDELGGTAETFVLPAGADVLSTALDGDDMALTVRHEGVTSVYLIELPQARIKSQTVISR